MAYVDYNDLIVMVEELLSGLVKTISGSHILKYTVNSSDRMIDFTPPFKRIHILNELEKQTGEQFNFNDFSSPEFEAFLNNLCTRLNVDCGAPRTIPRMLDKLIGEFIEPQCINPTFLTNHPLVMSPLAKHDRNDPRLSERFELFVNGIELSNAYTELNNHVIQEKAFRLQQKDKGMGDEEVPLPDEDFIDALKYGLPPTGGCGIGIDRLVMFLTNHTSIKEVIAFPM
jgi:lysyl-tRNA synthetase class 2